MGRIYDRIKGRYPRRFQPIVVILMNNPNVRKKNWRRYAKANRCFKKRKTALGRYGCYVWNHLCKTKVSQVNKYQLACL